MVGQEVTLNGWVNRNRDQGGIAFLDLRDRTGLVQVVTDGSVAPEALQVVERTRSEFCLSVRGVVRRRPEGTENPNLKTGTVEVAAREIEILNPAKTPPFPIAEDKPVDEMVRLKYRYLDLRRPAMYERLRLRHEAIRLIREFMYGRGFLEIETPILTKSSPEGARDYLVPYRLEPGLFYALAAGPPAVQAAPDGRGRGALLPDRQVLPRRGPARRPPAGVHPARPGDVVRDPGRRAGSGRVAVLVHPAADHDQDDRDAVHAADLR